MGGSRISLAAFRTTVTTGVRPSRDTKAKPPRGS